MKDLLLIGVAFIIAIVGFFLILPAIAYAQKNNLYCDISVSSQTTNEILAYLKKINDATQIRMITSGTEYYAYEKGTVFARLLDGNSNPINLASCNTTVYYPNKTSKFLSDAQMTLLERGIYYKDFTLGNVIGNYIVSFDCQFPSNSFTQNQTYGGIVITGTEPFTSYFPFDNSNGLTINDANLSVAVSSGVYDVYFNNQIVLNNVGSTNGTILTYSTDLFSSNFTLTENQYYMIKCNSGCPMNFFWINLYVNYTWNNPSQIIRGQTELNVKSLDDIAIKIVEYLYMLKDKLFSVRLW